MEDKIDQRRYKLLEEFHVDALNIVHNMVIYNGGTFFCFIINICVLSLYKSLFTNLIVIEFQLIVL